MMSKTHVIDGKKYVEVERKAEVGEKVIIVINSSSGFGEGHIGEVTRLSGEGAAVIDYKYYHRHYDYHVLEPAAESKAISKLTVDISANAEVIDIIANLARRVSSLEQQLADAQRNIERMGYEQSEAGAKVEMLLNDIVMLDERTQTRHADVVTFDKFLDSVAEKVADRLVGRQ